MKGGARHIKDLIYGANDGIITTFTIVAGVAGASLPPQTILLLGVANLLADGFSMAASNYLGSKSERDVIRHSVELEEAEIKDAPEEERKELVDLLLEHGYDESDADTLARLLFKNKKFFTDLMIHEELDLSPHEKTFVLGGPILTFLSFVIAGLVPILPFLFLQNISNIFLYSIISTAIILFFVGALRSVITKKSLFLSGFEMLCVGGVAASIAYSVGFLLAKVI